MRRKRIKSFGELRALALLMAIAGCGGPSEEKATSSPPATGTVAATAGGMPAAQQGTTPAVPIVPTEPTDTRQLAAVLDLSKLPMPEGAKITEKFATQLHVTVPLPAPSATEFYLDKLQALGWKRVGDPASASITDSFAQVSIGKDGYQLLLTVMSGQPKGSAVTIAHVGNFDTRTLPRVDGAEDQYSCPFSSLYFTPVKVSEATASLRRLLAAAGWQEYDRAFTQKADRPEASDLLFRKRAYSVAVSIRKPPAQPGKTAVQYYVTTLAHDLPAPTDARHVEIQDSRWILMCDIPRDLAAAADYYRKAMQEIGFPTPHETPIGKELTLSFESDGHDIVLVNLKATDEHTTKAKLEGYSAEFLAEMKKAEAEAKLKREAQEKAEAEAKAERVKAFREASKQEDDKFNAVLEKALSGAAQPKK